MIGRFAQLGVDRELLRRRDFHLALSAGLLALAAYLTPLIWPGALLAGDILALASVGLGGAPIVWGALRGLVRREVNVDELVSLAIVAALLQGEFLTAAVVSLVMTLGSLLEQAASQSARSAIRSLMDLTPPSALLWTPQGERLVSLPEVKPGDLVLIKPGARVPVDAQVEEGLSALDESAMTGESLPVEKGPGAELLAGTLNLTATLKARAVKVGAQTTLAKVTALVAQAESHRPRAVRFIDRYAAWFTPAILACAGLTWLLTGSLDRAVAVLIVGCPCALILAAPTATVATLGRAARAGVLVKGGQHLETAAGARSILFDKTGTLTLGRPRVEQVICAPGWQAGAVLALAAGAEQDSPHPLARAIIQAAREAGAAPASAQGASSQIGLGVRALVQGATVEVSGPGASGGLDALPPALAQGARDLLARGLSPLVVRREGQVLAVLGVADQVRPGAAQALEELRALGLTRLGILSGDQEPATRQVGRAVGVEDLAWGLGPPDKLVRLQELAVAHSPVIFVGDGINDAPALAAADLGVAMAAAGTEVALETADVALTHDDLARLPFLIRLSRRMLAIIKLNIVFGVLFNAVAVLASGWGLLSPIAAALTHNLGSVLVVMASASLAFFPEPEGDQARPAPLGLAQAETRAN